MATDIALALEETLISRHSIIGETIARGDSEVQQFYADAVIFITGGSGFLGKQLIEKLFRSCKIKKVFMLLRSKKQKTIGERLAQILKDPVYEGLKEHCPDFATKVVPISGDVTEIRLGISDEDWTAITEEVNIIFHGAATINFVEALKKATLTNVRGTREVLRLGKACKKLISFVHVSTAYSHATNDRVGEQVMEQFYPSPMPYNTMIELAENMDDRILDQLTPHLLGKWPNSYTFTKAIAEQAVAIEGAGLPICIMRPAIVICSYREPSPGWLDLSCAFGPSGLILGGGLGVIHVVYTDINVYLDLVTVDLANNAAIIAARETAIRQESGEKDIKIYTVSGVRNPAQLSVMFNTIDKEGRDYSSDKCLWYGFSYYTANKFILWFWTTILHIIPGLLADFILLLLGKRPIATKMYRLFYKLNDVLSYFLTREWRFSDTNLMEMYRGLSPSDRIIYNCDMGIIDWREFILLWCVGIRKYIVKDGLNNTAKGVRKQFWLRIVNAVFTVLYIYMFWKIFSYLYSVVSNLVFCT